MFMLSCCFSEDAGEVAVVGGLVRACSVPACLAEVGGESEAEFDLCDAGTADERQRLEIQPHGKDTVRDPGRSE